VLCPQTFACAREWPSLISTFPAEDGGPSYNFLKGVKNWLKIWRSRACKFWGWRKYFMILSAWRAIRWAWSLRYNFWGPAPRKFGRAKKSKIRPNFGQLSTLTVNILGSNRNIKNKKQTWSITISTGFGKILVNFGPLTKELQARMLTHPKSTMRVLRMLMHLISGHVTLLLGGISTPWINSPIGLRVLGSLTLGFTPNF